VVEGQVPVVDLRGQDDLPAHSANITQGLKRCPSLAACQRGEEPMRGWRGRNGFAGKQRSCRPLSLMPVTCTLERTRLVCAWPWAPVGRNAWNDGASSQVTGPERHGLEKRKDIRVNLSASVPGRVGTCAHGSGGRFRRWRLPAETKVSQLRWDAYGTSGPEVFLGQRRIRRRVAPAWSRRTWPRRQ
jgi:hypothetical protein